MNNPALLAACSVSVLVPVLFKYFYMSQENFMEEKRVRFHIGDSEEVSTELLWLFCWVKPISRSFWIGERFSLLPTLFKDTTLDVLPKTTQ